MKASSKVTLRVRVEEWHRTVPVRITGYSRDSIDVVHVELQRGVHIGRGEAGGIYYNNESAVRMLEEIEAVRADIESGVDRLQLQRLMPPGGSRNALDCALWDLEAKTSGVPTWRRIGLSSLRPLLTAFTCHADGPQEMAARARSYIGAKAIKLKLTGEHADVERVHAVRASLPDVWLAIDANQGFHRGMLEQMMPELVRARVSLIEQPFPRDRDSLLDGFCSPIPIAADESVLSLGDLPRLLGRFQAINIKLDKCGGLTEALAMVAASKALGFKTMVGNMSGTSLAMAPAFLIGQHCDIVDLDGPIFLKADRSTPVQYASGFVTCPPDLWGG